VGRGDGGNLAFATFAHFSSNGRLLDGTVNGYLGKEKWEATANEEATSVGLRRKGARGSLGPGHWSDPPKGPIARSH
jgi:hypothetical protein